MSTLTVSLVLLASALYLVPGTDALTVGRGIADITGLAAEGALYGYAKPDQTAQGLHLRQYSRAFVFNDGFKAVAFAVVEVTLISDAVFKEVVEILRDVLGNVYTEENIMLSPTHSHAAPGGYNTYWMYQAPTLGFINETYDAVVEGIVLSILRAHNDARDAMVYINSDTLEDANFNRSPYAYYNNPIQEIIRYQYDVDKLMTVLKMTDLSTGARLGMISFFAVHTTSMKNYNHLVSSDNKGYAAQMMERYLNPDALPGQGEILAAFTQTAEGDASPNTDGSRCDITEEYCWENTSTCPQWPQDPTRCTGRGPAGEQFADTAIIGDAQFQMARNLFEYASESVGTVIDYRMQWVNMSNITVLDEINNPIKTCRPSMGYSFAAGATDGPGIPPFYQAMLEPLENIDEILGRVFNMSDEIIACQAPKPILFPTGELEDQPWPWQPEILPLSIVRIGDLFLVGVPAEVTTMSARRIETAVTDVLTDNGLPSSIRVLIVSMVNSFSSYLVTYEEYQMQRYEGASTIFGPNTLQAYIIKYEEIALALATGQPLEVGEPPADLREYQHDALGIIRRDDPPAGMTYGDVLDNVDPQYARGETASITFVAGNPRNNLRSDGTFLEVQRQLDSTSWEVVATDANWETKFFYTASCDENNRRNDTCTPVSQESNATITWDIPTIQQPGTYRIVHYGSARNNASEVEDYIGMSSDFEVLSSHSDSL